MKFGLGPLTTQIPPGDPRTDAAKYREVIELAQLAEDEGYDRVWVSEHHAEDDHYLSSMFTMCAAIAQATKRIEIGTNIALAPLYHPIRLAEDAASVDVLSEGRFILGLGLGYRDHEFEMFDVDKSNRVDRLIDCLEVCKRGWEGERFSYNGNQIQLDDHRITPQPVQGSNLPIIIGAVSEPAARRSAKRADGITMYTHNDGQIEQLLEWVHDEGVDEGFIQTALREISIGDSKQEAWDNVKEGSHYINQRYYKEFGQSSDDLDVPPPEEAEQWVVFGDPGEVTDRMHDYSDLLGPSGEVCCWIDHPGLDFDVVKSMVRRFGREVIPHVRKRDHKKQA